MDKGNRQQTITDYQRHPKDTGSSGVQIALITQRIGQLTEHLKTHRKDNHTRRGLMQMVGQRRRLLVYLAREEPDTYTALISRLGLRR
ncbi:MAG: 30S ribosomal protein S15 [Dehalococcoidia bacterium]|nr:30S ribosomal protein S15 [Dehalococcoidia bacterium]